MFIEIYRCKMCGKEIEKRSVIDIIADAELLTEKNNSRHFCENGDLGITEFVGFKRMCEK